MPVERSAGAVIFRKEEGKVFYLLLHYPASFRTSKDFWELPKGHLEPGETEEKTVRREVEEETGLKEVKFISGFRETIKYFFKWEGKTIFKTVAFYLLETKTKEIKISGEHIGLKWLLYDKAFEQLTHKNAKEILQKANDFLSGKSIQSSKENS